ncbi:hypothetical protein BHU09_02770 [Tannerella sp. oral taxon 808]|nr:hypothetical protein BHU09_02770 [Tannerella sp. oral taxon 808]
MIVKFNFYLGDGDVEARSILVLMSFFSSLDVSSFLVLTQEKKQKKVKASGTPAKFAGYRENFLASVEGPTGAGEYGRVHP